MDNKFSKILIPSVLILTALLVLGFWALYQPKAEREFITALNRQLVTDKTSIKIADIVPFSWDRVCGISINSSLPPGLTKEDIESFLEVPIQSEKIEVPSILFNDSTVLIPRPSIQLILFFINDEKLIQTLKFKLPYAKKISDRIFIRMKDEEKKCLNKESAYLSLKKTDAHTYLEIQEGY